MGEVIAGIPFSLEELSGIRPVEDSQQSKEFYWNAAGYRLDGAKVRDLVVKKLSKLTEQLKSEFKVAPGIGIIQSGDDTASNTYVSIKERKATEAGFKVIREQYKAGTDQKTLLEKIKEFNTRDDIHGFIVQLPLLPEENFSVEEIISSIDPLKDADCFHPFNVGEFYTGDSYLLAPATAQGSLIILKVYGVPMADREGRPYAAAIAGRSDIAGKPFGRVLEAKCNDYNLSYHLMNSRSDTHGIFRSGNYQVLVSAVGKIEFTPEDVPHGTPMLIDVGTNFIPNPDPDAKRKTIQCGDFDPAAYGNARVIIPSPGGTGPGTVTALLVNAFNLAAKSAGYRPH